MEDAATAEISRSQIWQWVHHRRIPASRSWSWSRKSYPELGDSSREAARLFIEVALAEEFVEFMTVPAYRLLP